MYKHGKVGAEEGKRVKQVGHSFSIAIHVFGQGISSTVNAAIDVLSMSLTGEVRTRNLRRARGFEKVDLNSYMIRRSTVDAEAIQRDYEKIGKDLFRAVSDYQQK